MAAAQVALHLGAAEIEITILEANLLGGRVAVGNLERHGSGRAQRLESADNYLDFAGRKLDVNRAFGAAHHLAFDRDVELRSHVARSLVRGGIVLGIEDELYDPVAVAKVDEDDAAVVAPRLDPSPERDLAADVGGADCAAVIGARPGRQRRILFSLAHYGSNKSLSVEE